MSTTTLRADLAGETVLLVTHDGPIPVVHGLVDGDAVEVRCQNEVAWSLPADD